MPVRLPLRPSTAMRMASQARRSVAAARAASVLGLQGFEVVVMSVSCTHGKGPPWSGGPFFALIAGSGGDGAQARAA